jgi:hypothetical protein
MASSFRTAPARVVSIAATTKGMSPGFFRLVAFAFVDGINGSVAGGRARQGDGDVYAEQTGRNGGGPVGGELEQRRGTRRHH